MGGVSAEDRWIHRQRRDPSRARWHEQEHSQGFLAAGMFIARGDLSTNEKSDLNIFVQNALSGGSVIPEEWRATVARRQYDPGTEDGRLVVQAVAEANDDAIGDRQSLGNDDLLTVPAL
jgi:hypothetical protein